MKLSQLVSSNTESRSRHYELPSLICRWSPCSWEKLIEQHPSSRPSSSCLFSFRLWAPQPLGTRVLWLGCERAHGQSGAQGTRVVYCSCTAGLESCTVTSLGSLKMRESPCYIRRDRMSIALVRLQLGSSLSTLGCLRGCFRKTDDLASSDSGPSNSTVGYCHLWYFLFPREGAALVIFFLLGRLRKVATFDSSPYHPRELSRVGSKQDAVSAV